MPIITALIFIKLIKAIKQKKEVKPFIYTISLFLLGYLGLAISIWPYIVPYKVTLETAAATGVTVFTVDRSGDIPTCNTWLYLLLLLYIPWQIISSSVILKNLIK